MHADKPLLEIGLIGAGGLPPGARRLIRTAGSALEHRLGQWFPDFAWRVPVVFRRDIGSSREESSTLLHRAAEERNTERWDFVLLVTSEELIAHYRRYALAALSRPLDAAVISTARILPDGPPAENASDAPSEEVQLDRLLTLMLHAIGHLGGLATSNAPQHLLYQPNAPVDLDNMQHFSSSDCSTLNEVFTEMADTRLEEHHGARLSVLRFYLRAGWINRSGIYRAVVAARPWEFPERLNRLTTAAVSTLAVLLLTAEAWELGLSQSPTALAVLAVTVLASTTTLVIERQQLLDLRSRQLREQIVETRISASLIVLVGLAFTWCAAWLLSLLIGLALFDLELIGRWAGMDVDSATRGGVWLYCRMAGFAASVGLLIGSLGASFEQQHHFQHVIFVDEEL